MAGSEVTPVPGDAPDPGGSTGYVGPGVPVASADSGGSVGAVGSVESVEEPLVVGRIGRPHGVRGEVTIEVRTDVPEQRFATGSVLACDPVSAGPLTVAAVRWQGSRLVVHFEGVQDRSGAETLRNVLLTLDPADAGDPGDDAWWDHQLVGLAVVTVGGEAVGTVGEVLHTPAGELLSVRRPDGGEALVPFLRAMVPEVDVAGGRVVVDPPPGLLELS